uniref:OTU domain-containing protein n=1 Tax=Amphora coffeiformis TaxID=265554 RepID=A0A7S3L9S8_9STRA|mmetsp:Transcript_16269/g.32677  ORF Transcript_16269/g.32677 Transcript_16269/m.32677 type:complete len:378 (+) Transcript_16269:232-1365(+)
MPKGKKNKSAKKQNKKGGLPHSELGDTASPSPQKSASATGGGGAGNKRARKKKQHASKYYNTADDLILRQSIESDGTRTVLEMDPDGNCLFRSISDQLHHDYGRAHADVRHEICDYLEGHESFFSLFLDLDDEETKGEDASDFADYVNTMRQDGEWGGNLELVAAARLYRRRIRVFSSTLAAMNIDYDSDKPPGGPELLVSYHDNDHYNSVRDNSRSGKPPPPPIRTYEKQDCGPEIDGYPSDEGTSAKTEDNDSSRTQSTSSTQVTLNTQSTSLSSYGESLSSEDKSEETSGEATPSTETQSQESSSENHKPKKPPKANANCPCGSKLKYRKCCKDKDRRGAHQRRLVDQNGEVDKSDQDDVITHTMEGKFRVLSI